MSIFSVENQILYVELNIIIWKLEVPFYSVFYIIKFQNIPIHAN